MKISTLLAYTAANATQLVCALSGEGAPISPHDKPDNLVESNSHYNPNESSSSSSKFVRLKFKKSYGESYEDSSESRFENYLQKRANGYEDIQITNQVSFYSVDLDIGTPPQKVTVLVDTGSSDLWVTGSNNPYCMSPSEVRAMSAYYQTADIFGGYGDNNNVQDMITMRKQDILFSTEIILTNIQGGGGIDPFGWLTNSVFSFLTASLATATYPLPTAVATGAEGAIIPTVDCQRYGTFNPNDSSTFRSNHTNFHISYGDGSFASGTWGQDVLVLNDINVTGVSFAVADYTNSSVGVMGIGMAALESTYSGRYVTKPYMYENLPIVLRNSGAIDSITYSLFLNEPNAKTGSVLFGAVDRSKYAGQMYTVPMVNIFRDQGVMHPIEFDVTLFGIGLSSSDSDSKTTITSSKLPALLDSGTTITYLPSEIVALIAEEIGATYSEDSGFYELQCPDSDTENYTDLVFDFGGFHINAPLSDFLINLGRNVCLLGIGPQNSEQAILGDVFLSNAYVVYDLENYEISLAQASYENADSTNQDEIEVITSGVPGAVKAASYYNSWSTPEPIQTGGNIFTVNGNSTEPQGTGAIEIASSLTGVPASLTSTGASSSTRTSEHSSSSRHKNDAGAAAYLNAGRTGVLALILGSIVSFLM